MSNESVLTMKTFSAGDWDLDETGLFADNVKTGERIMLERFVQEARNGIAFDVKTGVSRIIG